MSFYLSFPSHLASNGYVYVTVQEEYRSKLAGLEQQVACLEDELCEARLNASKLNTELVSERSSAEVRLAEMQSRLNEVTPCNSIF